MPDTHAKPDDARPTWDEVQIKYADIPGLDGIKLRHKAYTPYFLRMGTGVQISEGCRFTHPHQIVLDDDARIHCDAKIFASGGIHIGRHARIGPSVFIHSANHDIAPGSDAYFERGYDYDQVSIGDNCLLSANVSILPGAQLAPGCFVACGAVVTKGTYQDSTRLMGVPAKGTPPQTKSHVRSAAIAICTPASGPYGHMADVLVGTLGLPQLCVYREGERIADAVHAVVLLGPADWNPAIDDQISTWRLDEGELSIDEDVQITSGSQSEQSEPVLIPYSRARQLIPTVDPNRSNFENACSLSIYYASKRLRKKHELMNPAERLDLYLALFLLDLQNTQESKAVYQTLIEFLPSESNAISAKERDLCTLISGDNQSNQREPLREVIIELVYISDTVREKLLSDEPCPYNESIALACPMLIVERSLRSSQDHSQLLLLIEQVIPQATKATQLAHFGIAAVILKDDRLFSLCIDRIFQSDFFDDEAKLIRSAKNTTGYCYSPSLAALLLIGCDAKGVTSSLRFQRTHQELFIWDVFAGDESILSIRSESASGTLIDLQRQRISRSLLKNWVQSVSIPKFDGYQHEISDDDYSPIAARLEQVWTTLFRHIQHQAGQSLIRVLPWPAPYHAAISVRYDIDRNTSTQQVQEIMHIHSRLLNGACGSWYAIKDTPFGDRLAETLPRHLQEVGVHALSCTENVCGQGVTHHSAPNSEYWRGQHTIESLNAGDARYGEMLSGQLSKPRRAYLGDMDTGKASSLWVTPLHFPLEGSTNDQDLSYFDHRLTSFRELLNDGGHAIVGCHPDLNSDLLVQLLERERSQGSLDGVWTATVGQAVERCRQLDSICVVEGIGSEKNTIHLCCQHTIADVQIEIDTPNDGTHKITTQLNAKIPRALECL